MESHVTAMSEVIVKMVEHYSGTQVLFGNSFYLSEGERIGESYFLFCLQRAVGVLHGRIHAQVSECCSCDCENSSAGSLGCNKTICRIPLILIRSIEKFVE